MAVFTYTASHGVGKGQKHVSGTVTAASEDAARAKILDDLRRAWPTSAVRRTIRIQSITAAERTNDMAGEGGGKIPQAILNGVAQANVFLGAGLTIIATYKAAREAWKAAHPTTDPTAAGWKSDDDLIALAGQAADALVAHADQVLAKHQG